jgi:hypothetical protein
MTSSPESVAPATVERWNSPAEAAVERGVIVPLDGGEHPDGFLYTITVQRPAGSGPRVYGFRASAQAPDPTLLPRPWADAVWVAGRLAVFAFPAGADVRRWRLESPFVRFVTSGADRLVVIYESGLFAVDQQLTLSWERSTDLIVNAQERAGAILVEQMDGPTLVVDAASGHVTLTS